MVTPRLLISCRSFDLLTQGLTSMLAFALMKTRVNRSKAQQEINKHGVTISQTLQKLLSPWKHSMN